MFYWKCKEFNLTVFSSAQFPGYFMRVLCRNALPASFARQSLISLGFRQNVFPLYVCGERDDTHWTLEAEKLRKKLPGLESLESMSQKIYKRLSFFGIIYSIIITAQTLSWFFQFLAIFSHFWSSFPQCTMFLECSTVDDDTIA